MVLRFVALVVLLSGQAAHAPTANAASLPPAAGDLKIIVHGVGTDADAATIDAATADLLDEVAEMARESEGAIVIVIPDDTGGVTACDPNRTLHRVDVARSYLASHGVSLRRLSVDIPTDPVPESSYAACDRGVQIPRLHLRAN